MIIIETHTKDSRTYISGIFSEHSDASRHLAEVPFRQGEVTLVHNLDLSYPLYIVEKQWDRLLYTGENGLRTALRSMADEFSPEEEGEPVCNVYTVTQDYVPDTAGNDEMGKLRHRHVMGEELENLEAVMERVKA